MSLLILATQNFAPNGQANLARLDVQSDQANGVPKTIKCPTCGQSLPSGQRKNPRPKVLRVGEMVLNPAIQEVTWAGEDLILSQRKFQLLESLIRRKGLMAPIDALVDSVWQSGGVVNHNLKDVSIYQLRKKVDRGHKVRRIKTVRRSGYPTCRHHRQIVIDSGCSLQFQ